MLLFRCFFLSFFFSLNKLTAFFILKRLSVLTVNINHNTSLTFMLCLVFITFELCVLEDVLSYYGVN